jgi:hypothetical protein
MARGALLALAMLLVLSNNTQAQPLGPPDQVAAKNIFLVSTAVFKCRNLLPSFAKIKAYALQKKIDNGEFNKERGKYAAQKVYAMQIADAHIKIAGVDAFCKAVIADFGPRGKLVQWLVNVE